MGRAPTIYDVAELAGVGRTTVSRVLNGAPKVSAATRERVLAAVARLRFKVNAQARLLAGGRVHTIRLVHPINDEQGPLTWYNMLIESGAQRGCAEAGLLLQMDGVFPDSLQRHARILEPAEGMACDGIILAPPFSDDAELIALIKARHIPLACLAAGPQTRSLSAGIGMDDEAAGFDLTQYLLKLGHRRFAFLHGLKAHVSAAQRYHGFCRALDRAAIPLSEVVAFQGKLSFATGVQGMQGVIDSGHRPTAVVCANDEMAAGALYRAHQAGLSVPRDVTIVGFDDAPFSPMLCPPLTTMQQPIFTMAHKAVGIIVREIESPSVQRPGLYEIAPHRLVVRDSAAPAEPFKADTPITGLSSLPAV